MQELDKTNERKILSLCSAAALVTELSRAGAAGREEECVAGGRRALGLRGHVGEGGGGGGGAQTGCLQQSNSGFSLVLPLLSQWGEMGMRQRRFQC